MPLSDKGLYSSPPERPESVPDGMMTLWDALMHAGKALFGDEWDNHDVFAHRVTETPGEASTVQLERSVGSWERGHVAWRQLHEWLQTGKVQAFRLPDTPIKPDAWEENRARFILRSGKIRRLGRRPWDWVLVSKDDLDQAIAESAYNALKADT